MEKKDEFVRKFMVTMFHLKTTFILIKKRSLSTVVKEVDDTTAKRMRSCSEENQRRMRSRSWSLPMERRRLSLSKVS